QSFIQTQLRKRKIRLQSVNVSSLQTTGANSLLLEGSVVTIDAHLFQSKLQPLITQQLEQKKMTQKQSLMMDKKLQQLKQCVVYQDEQFVVLNKPQGLAVQDGSALTESLDRYLSPFAELLREDSDVQELKLVHRLDKETSGVLVLARSRLAAAKFSELMRSGAVQKTYEALVATSPSSDSYSLLKKFEGKEMKLPVDGKAHGYYFGLVQDVNTSSVCTVLKNYRIRFRDPFNAGKAIDVSCKMESPEW
ncbi:Pseudouridine synthase, partial [Phytophthora palmivora]